LLLLAVRERARVDVFGASQAGGLDSLVDPDAGTVTYFEETTDADTVRDRVSVLTQNPAEYLFNPTVREDLAYGPAQQDLTRAEIDRHVERVADRLELDGLLSKPPYRLSGGQQRRAALASALTVDPDVLLLDEPVSNVDAANRDRILGLLERLSEEGVTLVTSTPDTELVPHVADRVILLDDTGSVAATGATREILTDTELLTDCDLRPPQVVRLFADRTEIPLTVQEARALLDEE
jgi:cobalt/nickel transport system ATP-binding protein